MKKNEGRVQEVKVFNLILYDKTIYFSYITLGTGKVLYYLELFNTLFILF